MMKFKILCLILTAGFLLRFYNLGLNPPSLYWDEVSLGYNSFSIFKTLKDEHGVFLPITNFAAFGDYKPPIYIYLSVPSIAIFGLTDFAVRFPSAFFGTTIILVVYFLVKKMFDNEKISLLSALLLAISPWHINLSRVGFEANIGLFTSLLAIYLFIKSQTEKSFYVLLSGILFMASMYTFTGQRLFVPLIVIVLTIIYRKEVIINFKYNLIALIVSAIIFIPIFTFSTQTIEGKLRFDEVTIFKDLEPINNSIRYRDYDGFSTLSNFIHNRRFYYLHEYLKHYFDAFNPIFLFTSGDHNPRFSTQHMGQLYLADIILVPLGLYLLASKRTKSAIFVLSWLVVSPMGPATARETPHALRMIHILPTFQIATAFALSRIIEKTTKYRTISIIVIILLTMGQFSFYIWSYYFQYPKEYSQEWQYGYKQAVEKSLIYRDEVDKIVVTQAMGRPYIYFAFYTKYDPAMFQSDAKFQRDSFFFYNVEGFDKYVFSDNYKPTSNEKILYILNPNSLPNNVQKIDTITALNGKPMLEIGISK